MAKKRRVKRAPRRPKITFIFFHGDAMDLVEALESKIKESGLSMQTVISAIESQGVNLSSVGVPGPRTPSKPN